MFFRGLKKNQASSWYLILFIFLYLSISLLFLLIYYTYIFRLYKLGITYGYILPPGGA